VIRFAADENLHGDLLRALQRRWPSLEIVRVQDTEMLSADDETLLAWCALENRVLLTHDVKTMPGHAMARLDRGERLAGVFLIPAQLGIGEALADLELVIECSLDGEWDGRLVFLPMRS
jgi:hypothetical protein